MAVDEREKYCTPTTKLLENLFVKILMGEIIKKKIFNFKEDISTKLFKKVFFVFEESLVVVPAKLL